MKQKLTPEIEIRREINTGTYTQRRIAELKGHKQALLDNAVVAFAENNMGAVARFSNELVVVESMLKNLKKKG